MTYATLVTVPHQGQKTFSLYCGRLVPCGLARQDEFVHEEDEVKPGSRALCKLVVAF